MTKRRTTVDAFLRETPWMATLPEAVRARVVADSYDLLHRKGEIVARRGEPVATWIGVMEGCLKVTAQHETGKVVMFGRTPPNAWVGEGSVIKHERRKYDLVAIQPSRTIHVPRETFFWLLDTSFEFNRFIINHLNERLGRFMGMVETDRLADPVARLARALCGMFNETIYPGAGTRLRVSQEDLGNLSGLTRQRVNNALRELKAGGVVQVTYGGIVVEDLEALERLAERS